MIMAHDDANSSILVYAAMNKNSDTFEALISSFEKDFTPPQGVRNNSDLEFRRYMFDTRIYPYNNLNIRCQS